MNILIDQLIQCSI